MKRLRYILLSSRPVSWLNTSYPFAAGYVMTYRDFDTRLLLGTLYFLIPYNLMMYGVNDVFDYESDILNPRKGGIEGAKLAKTQHKYILWSVLLLNVPFFFIILGWGNTSAKVIFGYLIFMVLAYSLPKLRFKERPFLDSFTSSTHFVSPLVYVLVLVGWQSNYLPFVIAFFLWGMASHAFGSVQDIISDRAGKIASIGTVLGAKATTTFAVFLYAISSIILISRGTAGIVCAGVCLLYVANVYPFINISDKNSESANKGWRRFIWLNLFSGFVVTMVLIAVYNS